MIKTIKKLLENRLKTITPSLPIAFENVSFTPPQDGSKYLRCSLSINKPNDNTIGTNYYRENTVFNVYVLDKLNIGTGSALDTAESIRGLFNKGTVLQEGNVILRVLETPYIMGTAVTTDRLVIPIAIRATVEIN